MSLPIFKSDFQNLVFDGIPIVLADMDTGEILDATRPAEMLFGYTMFGEMVGMNVDDLVADAFRPRHAALRAGFAKAPVRKQMGERGPLRGHKRDGDEFPVEIVLLPGKLSQRRVVAAIVFDMTSRQP